MLLVRRRSLCLLTNEQVEGTSTLGHFVSESDEDSRSALTTITTSRPGLYTTLERTMSTVVGLCQRNENGT